MIPKFSFLMLGRNFDLVFKVLIYVFVLMLVCVALLVAIINPILDILNSNIDFPQRLLNTFSELLTNENPDVFDDLWRDFRAVVQEISSEIYLAILLIFIVGFITKFFFSLTAVPLGEVIYGRMSSNFSVMFHNVLVSSLGRSLLYSLIFTSVTIVVDAIIIGVSYFILRLLYSAIGVYAISLSAFLCFGLIATRMALLSQWVPQIVCEKKSVTKAFRHSFKYSVKYFWKVMPVIFVAIILGFSVFMTTLVLTFGLLPALMVPFLLIFMCNLNLVTYFVLNKKKFYVDEVTVANEITVEDVCD